MNPKCPNCGRPIEDCCCRRLDPAPTPAEKTKHDDGGQAYPHRPLTPVAGSPGLAQIDQEPGMTLLDYFAGQALTGLGHEIEVNENCNGDTWNALEEDHCEVIAAACYHLADAMIAEKRRREAQR